MKKKKFTSRAKYSHSGPTIEVIRVKINEYHSFFSNLIFRHTRRCMHYIYYWGEQNHITFLGDSRIRQLYFEFVNLLSLQRIDDHKAHQNLYFEDKKISVKAVCILKNICCSNDLPNSYLLYFYNKTFKKKVNRKKNL